MRNIIVMRLILFFWTPFVLCITILCLSHTRPKSWHILILLVYGRPALASWAARWRARRPLQCTRTGVTGCHAFSYKTNVSDIKGTSFHPTTHRRECPLICQHNIFSARLACNISWPRVAVCRPPNGCVKLFSFMSQDTAFIWTFLP